MTYVCCDRQYRYWKVVINSMKTIYYVNVQRSVCGTQHVTTGIITINVHCICQTIKCIVRTCNLVPVHMLRSIFTCLIGIVHLALLVSTVLTVPLNRCVPSPPLLLLLCCRSHICTVFWSATVSHDRVSIDAYLNTCIHVGPAHFQQTTRTQVRAFPARSFQSDVKRNTFARPFPAPVVAKAMRICVESIKLPESPALSIW